MASSATRTVPSREALLDQVLAEAPIRSSWFARYFAGVSLATQVALDFLSVVAALVVLNALYNRPDADQLRYPLNMVLLTAVFVSGSFVFLLERYGLYRPSSSLLQIRETERILRSMLWSTATLAVSTYVFLSVMPSTSMLVLWAVLLFGVVVVQRTAYYSVLRHLHARGYGLDRVLIYGCTPEGIDVFRKMVQSPRAGLVPVGIVDKNPALRGQRIYESSYTRRVSLPVVGTGDELDEILNRLQVTRIVLADGPPTDAKYEPVFGLCEKHRVKIAFVSPERRLVQHEVNYINLDGVMLGEIRPIRESGVYRFTKRALDLVLATLMLLVSLPVMAIVVLAIWKTDGRPALFAQERVGQFGRKFRLFKFRTMYRDAAAYAPTPRDQSDPRVTPLGRFLRRASLDELPQLINILRGDMSLVGPRPEMPFIVAKYTPAQQERLLAKPGLTGLWQISADRAFEIHENIDYDLYYIQNRSVLLDVAILLHTAVFAIRGAGAF